VKFGKNGLSLAVLNIRATKCLLWGIKSSNIFSSFLYFLLSVFTKLFACTNLIPYFTKRKTSYWGYDVDQDLNQEDVLQSFGGL